MYAGLLPFPYSFDLLSLSLVIFIQTFVHLRKVGGFPGSRSQSRTKIFAREVFSLRQGPRTTNFFPSQPLPPSFSTYPNRKKNSDFLSNTQPSQWILALVPVTTVRFSFLAFSARL